MSVIKNLRKLSDMEFYKNAINIRAELTRWLMRDFGEKKHPKNIAHTIKDVTPDETKIINDIFEKHGKGLNKEFVCEYPQWFIDAERKIIIETMWQMVSGIIAANSVYPALMAEWEQRRFRQNEAIAAVRHLFYELEYIARLFPQNLNYFEKLLDSLEREEHLLKGWRQSDNKSRRKVAEKLKKDKEGGSL